MAMSKRAVIVAVWCLCFALPASVQATRPQTTTGSADATVEQRVNAILDRMTLEQKIDLIGGIDDFYIRGYDQLGWPRLKMADGPMGVRNFGPSTAYPAGIALAASWNPELANRIGKGLGRDARAKGVHFLLGPGVNIYRAPMNGRNFEYFGEDPYLSSRIAVGYIEGVQSEGVIATIKHYADNNSDYDRHNTNSEVDERTQREIYFPAFEAGVKEAHVGAIMDSYNLINGEHATQNGFLNNQVAKKDWRFNGIIMSDWDATYDGVAAANGGLDLEMPSGKFMNRQTLLPAVKQGKVATATIDDKVRSILRTAIEFGFLDRDQTDLNVPRFNEEDRQVALDGARESIVLLKNEGPLLPLNKQVVRTIAILGPDAYPAQPVGGGSAQVEPFYAVSYLEGIANYLGTNTRVVYNRGVPDMSEISERSHWVTAAQNGQPGLRAEYFNNPDLSGQPAVVRTDRTVGNPALEPGAKGYSVRWSGYYIPYASGTYRWFTSASGSDSYRLFVDDQVVIEQPRREGQVPLAKDINLQAGKPYRVRFEYSGVENWLGSSAQLGVMPVDEIVSSDAKKIAAMADVALVFAGYSPQSESEGADRTFQLPPNQDDLIQAIAAANKNTIVALTAGGNVDMTPWIGLVPVLLHGWYLGQEAGTAMAEVLFGDVNPSAKLPVTFERRWKDNPVHDNYYPNAGGNNVAYREGVFVGYRGYEHNGTKPMFPFGYGLSYTAFAFKNLNITPPAPRLGEKVSVTFDVTNIGQRAGAEVAQLYIGNPTAPVPRPPKELKGFHKVSLNPGESTHLTLVLDPRAMSFYDVKSHSWKQEPGKFTVFVGHSSADIDLKGEYTVSQ